MLVRGVIVSNLTCRNSREKRDSHQHVQRKTLSIRLKRLQSHSDLMFAKKITRWVVVGLFLSCNYPNSIHIFIMIILLPILLQMRLENVKAGRKGNLNVATEVTLNSTAFIVKENISSKFLLHSDTRLIAYRFFKWLLLFIW